MDLLSQQLSAKEKLINKKVGALFMEAGTGKTRVALELVNSIPGIDLVLWIAPLGTIRDGSECVKNEIHKWGGFKCNAHYVGIESIGQSDRIYLETLAIIGKAKTPCVVIDESIKIKNISAQRTNRALEISKKTEYKLILNGTPLSRNLLDLWAQMEFLSPQILNMDIAEFKNTFCKYQTVTYKHGRRSFSKEYITGYENIDYLHSLIDDFIYECDLSLDVETRYSELKYRLDEYDHAEYASIKQHMLENEYLLHGNGNFFLSMTQKMQHSYCCTPNKFEVLDAWFENHDQATTIIFCKFIRSQRECSERYPKAKVLSYQKHSFGLNLQEYNSTVYFDKTFDWALRNQSGNRTYRTGQKEDCKYLDLTGDVGLESLIDKNIREKVNMIEYFKMKAITEIKKDL
ncbi:MAG: SNF2-related protein [Dysgonomonas sp.]